VLEHAKLVQGVLTKLGNRDLALKASALTITTAAAGAALAAKVSLVVWPAALAVLALMLLDGFYLNQRRMFRRLYDAVRQGGVEWLSMDTQPYATGCRYWSAMRSRAVLLPYLPLVATLAVCGLI
jgi:hypothetical protein